MKDKIKTRLERLEAKRPPIKPIFRREGETRQEFWQRICAAPLEVRQLRSGPYKPGHFWCWKRLAHIPKPAAKSTPFPAR